MSAIFSVGLLEAAEVGALHALRDMLPFSIESSMTEPGSCVSDACIASCCDCMEDKAPFRPVLC